MVMLLCFRCSIWDIVFLDFFLFFFFNDTATTEIYTLSLHDALPIPWRRPGARRRPSPPFPARARRDRKSTRLNSSHGYISYAVFCLKKKKKLNKGNIFKKKKNKTKLKKNHRILE